MPVNNHSSRGFTQPTASDERPSGYGSPKLSASKSLRAGSVGVFDCISNSIMGAVYTVVPPGGILSGACNMASASIGAGILGLPAATNSTGLVLAIILLVIITYLSVFSMYILALAAQSTRIKSFEGMARGLFPYGKYAFSYWTAFIRWFHSFAGCVAYVISVGNCLYPMFAESAKQHPDNSAIRFLATTNGNRVLTIIVWLCVMLPMAIPKHIDSLRYASAVAVSFMVYFVIMVVVHSCRNGLPETSKHVELSGNQANDGQLEHNTVFLFRSGNSVVGSVGVFVFAYVCQINAYEVFWDFRPEIRTTKNYTMSATIGMLLCGTLYALVCVLGYFDFGSKKLEGKSLLLMFNPLKDTAVMIAYVAVMIKLCVSYALLTISARNSLYYLIGFQHRYRNRPEAVVTKELDTVDNDSAVARSDALDESREMHAPEATQKGCETAGPAVEESPAGEVDSTAEDTSYVDNIPMWQHLIVVLILSIASLLCGLFIPSINTVFGFAGAISGGFLAFVFPALFVMYAGNFTVAQVGWFTYLNTYALLICGVCGIVFGTGGTIYQTI